MKWALVLSGGGGKGFVHLGILKALYQRGLKPSMIAGTSMGALIGGVHASGMPLDEMESYLVEEFDIRRFLDGWSYRLPQFPLLRFLQAGEALGNVLSHPGLDSGAKIRQEIDRLTGKKHFENCLIPFRCNAADLLTGEQVVFSSGPLTPALYSSMAYPGIFAPLHWGKRLFSDGAVVDNLPVHIPRKEGIPRVLAVDVAPFFPVEAKDVTNTLEVALRAFGIASNRYPRPRNNRATFTLTIPMEERSFQFGKTAALIARGEALVEEKEDEILRHFAPRPFQRFFPRITRRHPPREVPSDPTKENSRE